MVKDKDAASNEDVFDGFTLGDLSGMLTVDTDEPGLPKGLGDSDIPVVDPKDLPKGDDVDDDDDDSKDDVDDSADDDSSGDDDSVDDDSVDDDSDDVTDDDSTDDKADDLGEYEGDISKFFMGRMADELGWSLGVDEKFESVSDVVEYMEGIVAEASKPDFANEEIEKFNEFVKDGGSLRKFYEDTISNTIDLQDFSLEGSEENQRSIVREDLRNQGQSEKQISRKVERYENAGVLEEEAEDSLASVETFREKKAKKLLVETEKQARTYETQQQNFIDDVQSYVKKLKDIRGVSISDIDKKKLLNDIFRQDATGQTQYQKAYSSNIAKNLIESAYFTLMGDKILEQVKKKEQTNAAKILKQRLQASKSKRTKSKDNDQDSTVSGGLGILGDQLL